MISFNDIYVKEYDQQHDQFLESIYPELLPDEQIIIDRIKEMINYYDFDFDLDLNCDNVKHFIVEYITDHYDQYLVWGCQWFISKDEIPLFCPDEFEIDLSYWCNVDRLTKSRIEVINTYSDLYIGSNKYAYITTDKVVCIKINLEELNQYIKEQTNDN